MKIEIGSTQKKDGWITLDHSCDNFDLMFDGLDMINGVNIPDGSVEYFYMSHIIEHIPIPKLIDISKKMYQKLALNGVLRVVCPDLEENAKAYLRKDWKYFKRKIIVALKPPYTELGVGGMFFNTLFSHGSDTYLFDKTKKREIMGLAHISAYDFEMLKKIFAMAGFSKIKRSSYDSSVDLHVKDGQLFVNAFKV